MSENFRVEPSKERNRDLGVSEICFALLTETSVADLRMRSNGELRVGLIESGNRVNMEGMSYLTEGGSAPPKLSFSDFLAANSEVEMCGGTDHALDATLAHYTDLEAVEKILDSKSLKLGAFATANDDFESQDWLFDLYCKKFTAPPGAVVDLSEKLSNTLKGHSVFASFSIAYQPYSNSSIRNCPVWKHPSMWASYGRRNTVQIGGGAVLIFDRSKLLSAVKLHLGERIIWAGKILYGQNDYARNEAFRVDYDHLCSSDFYDYCSLHLSNYWRELFLVKYEGWAHENEYRIIANSPNAQPIFVPLQESLVHVLIGEGVTSEALDRLRNKALQSKIACDVVRWRNGIPVIS